MARAALAYHAITDGWPHPLAISPRGFRRQIEQLAARGLRGVTISEYADRPRPNTVAITFDDGFASVATAAKPILDGVGWPATVFLVTDAVGTPDPMLWLGGSSRDHDRERRPLAWDAVTELAAGGWEIGSHGRTHRLLSTLSDGELQEELAGSRAAIADHGHRCASISYPYGEVAQRVVEAARRAGYETGSGLAGRFHSRDPMRIPRVAVDGGDSRARFAVKTSPWFVTVRSTSLWTALEHVRRPGRSLGV